MESQYTRNLRARVNRAERCNAQDVDTSLPGEPHRPSNRRSSVLSERHSRCEISPADLDGLKLGVGQTLELRVREADGGDAVQERDRCWDRACVSDDFGEGQGDVQIKRVGHACFASNGQERTVSGSSFGASDEERREY